MIVTRKRARSERSDKGWYCRALRKNLDGVYDSNEREGRPRKSWYTSTCSEYVQKECVGIWRSRPADLLKEVEGSEGQPKVQDAAEEYEIIYSKGDVVGLKHNYKRYIIL